MPKRQIVFSYLNILRLVPLSLVFFIHPIFSYASEAASDNFSILESVISPGEYSTSSTYILLDDLDELVIGTSTASSFNLSDGFLFYPFVSTPIVSATAGIGKVSLAWTAAQGFLGWTVSNYNVGISTVSGSQYSYTSVGNTLSLAKENLTNGVTYYFIVQAEDAFGNSIVTSAEVSATPSGTSNGNGSPVSNVPSFVLALLPPRGPLSTFSRSDLNRDGKIGLRDLSILLARPEKFTGKALSYLFADWTETLPVPALEKNGSFASDYHPQRNFSEIKEVAQISDVFPSNQVSSQRSISMIVKSFFNNLVSLFRNLYQFFIRWSNKSYSP